MIENKDTIQLITFRIKSHRHQEEKIPFKTSQSKTNFQDTYTVSGSILMSCAIL